MSYVYEKNPEGMVQAMFGLYTPGTFSYDNGGDGFTFTSADFINNAVGSSTFDNNPGLKGKEVDQMLFMTLGECNLERWQPGKNKRDVE